MFITKRLGESSMHSEVALSSSQQIDLDHLVPSSTNAQGNRRMRFKREHLKDLAASIKTHGVLQPIVVRPITDEDGSQRKLEIVAGERRFVAAKLAGETTIPALVRDMTDEQVIEVQLIENLQREDLHALEEAEGYEELTKTHGHTVDEIWQKIGKSRSYVYQRMKLLALGKQARKAFYEDKINASVALLIARIPSDALQREALKYVTSFDEPLSFRRAADYVQRTFMLRLAEAPFDIKDAQLVVLAGACTTCPKRSGNEPDLFGDLKNADVCTDPPCFETKRKAHGAQLMQRAKEAGRPVITGKEAKRLFPHGTQFDGNGEFVPLDRRISRDPKWREAKAIVGKQAERVLIENATGDVVECVRSADVAEALKQQGVPANAPRDDGTAARRKAAKLDTTFRHALYEAVRPKLPRKLNRARLAEIAVAFFRRTWHEAQTPIVRLWGWELGDSYGLEGRAVKKIQALSEAELTLFVQDTLYVLELKAATWDDSKPDGLLAAAKRHKINVAAIRRAAQAKKKKKTKRAKLKAKKGAR